MEDLLLDSITEKLLAIDGKTTEILRATGETSRSINQIRSRLDSMESKERSSANLVQQFTLLPAEPLDHHGTWSQIPERKMRLILIPILSALAVIVIFSFLLTAGLRTSLLLPYLQFPKSTIQPPSSSTTSLIHQQPRTPLNKNNKAKKFRKQSSRLTHLNNLVHP